MAVLWMILDMDEGVIRREPTRRAAVAWIIGHHGGRVLQRYSYGPGGSYEYLIGCSGEDNVVSYFVERADAAVRAGWDWLFDVPDLYPYPDRPHETDPDIDRDALLAEASRRLRTGAASRPT